MCVSSMYACACRQVRIEWARETRRRVVVQGHPSKCYQLVEISGLGHSVSLEEFKDAGEFLARVLPADIAKKNNDNDNDNDNDLSLIHI